MAKRSDPLATKRTRDIGRRQWDGSRIATRIGSAIQPHPCRVCGETIPADTERLFISWGIDHAHVACGWAKPEEREPQRFYDHGVHVWRWACPVCNLMVFDTAEPPKKKDGTHARCYCAACVTKVKAGEISGKMVP